MLRQRTHIHLSVALSVSMALSLALPVTVSASLPSIFNSSPGLKCVCMHAGDQSRQILNLVPAWLQHILQQCFSFDGTKRPPVQQLLQMKPLSVWLAVSIAAVQPIAVMTFFMQLAADDNM